MSNKDKNLLGAIMVAAAAFLVFYFVLPNYDETKVFKKAVTERESLLKSRKEIMGQLDNLKKDYQKNKEEIDKISIIIPAEKHIPELVSAIENIAGTTGLALTTFNISDNFNKEADKEVRSLNLNAKLVGSYDAYRGFIAVIETSQRLIDVEISKITRDEESGVLIIDLAGRTYLLSKTYVKQ